MCRRSGGYRKRYECEGGCYRTHIATWIVRELVVAAVKAAAVVVDGGIPRVTCGVSVVACCGVLYTATEADTSLAECLVAVAGVAVANADVVRVDVLVFVAVGSVCLW